MLSTRGLHKAWYQAPINPHELKELLKDLYAAVLEGRVERAAAAVANQLANTRLRALEVECRIREQDELEGHLDELETMLEGAERRGHVARR